jgi:sugar/nucleoside kinase (ribokinase family)
VDKIKTKSPETLVSVNTWIDYIREGRKNRKLLNDIALKADFFIVNDTEAKALAQTDSISSAVRLLKAKRLIVTLGSLGAITSGENSELQMVAALTLPPDKVVDTTGAGDVWCGAFLATYNLTEDFAKAINAASTISRIKCSNWGFQSLINLRFKEPNDVVEFFMGLKDGAIQKRILDYTKS